MSPQGQLGVSNSGEPERQVGPKEFALSFATIVGDDWQSFALTMGAVFLCMKRDDQYLVAWTRTPPPDHILRDHEWLSVLPMPGASEAEARNQCLRQARHDWLLFVDSDELILSDNMDQLRRELTTLPPDAYCATLPVIQYCAQGGLSVISTTRLIRTADFIHYTTVGLHDTMGHSLPSSSIRHESHNLFIHHMDEIYHNRSLQKRQSYRARLEEALEVCSPDHQRYGALHRMLCQEYLALGMYSEVIGLVDRSKPYLTSIADEDIVVYKARALEKLDRPSEVLELLDKVQPRERGPRIQVGPIRANAYLALGEQDIAIAVLDDELVRYPWYPHTWLNRAWFHTDKLIRSELVSTAVQLSPLITNPAVVHTKPQPASLFASQTCIVDGVLPHEMLTERGVI